MSSEATCVHHSQVDMALTATTTFEFFFLSSRVDSDAMRAFDGSPQAASKEGLHRGDRGKGRADAISRTKKSVLLFNVCLSVSGLLLRVHSG